MRKEMLAVIRGEEIDLEQFYNSLADRTRRHSESVADITVQLLGWAEAGGLTEPLMLSPAELRRCAQYHDVGLALIPERLLLQKEDLTGAEYRVIQQHALYGGTLIDNYRKSQSFSPQENAFWTLAAEIALSHHERWDGKGYPYGQRASAVPLVIRATAIADAYDTMVRGSVYRIALPPEYAILEIIQNAGKQFDPELVEIFRQNCETILGRWPQEFV